MTLRFDELDCIVVDVWEWFGSRLLARLLFGEVEYLE